MLDLKKIQKDHGLEKRVDINLKINMKAIIEIKTGEYVSFRNDGTWIYSATPVIYPDDADFELYKIYLRRTRNLVDYEFIDVDVKRKNLVNTDSMMKFAILHERGEWNDDIKDWANVVNAAEVLSSRIFDKVIKAHDNSRERGLSSKGHPYKLLTYEVAARILVTIKDENNENTITIIGTDVIGSSTGIQSMYGSVDKIIQMLDYFIHHYHSIKFEEDKKISIV